jgi:hypothetical protein
VLGVAVIFITFAAGLVPPTRAGAAWQVAIGAGFVLVFAALLFARGWWVLSALLTVSNAWRATTYLGHGLGVHVDPRALRITPVPPRPVAFVNAALMAVIVCLLARSAWIGFSDWRIRRRIGAGS